MEIVLGLYKMGTRFQDIFFMNKPKSSISQSLFTVLLKVQILQSFILLLLWFYIL